MTISRYALSKLSHDAYLAPHFPAIRRRQDRVRATRERLTAGKVSLANFASGHEFFGLHRHSGGWVFTEWAPNATAISLIGTFSNWRESPAFALQRIDDHGTWQVRLPADALHHGDLYRLHVRWPGGEGDRIPAYVRRAVQDDATKIFSAQVWAPERVYRWKNPAPDLAERPPLIYEAHVGMAQEREGVGSYAEFQENTLPRVVDAGYSVLQLMALIEHPYYGSFGYHVSNFFAASSRFGTPEELKALIDAAHGAGLGVIMDMVHSHAVMNEVEGLSRFDGTLYQYFHAGDRGRHVAWDSRCFDYGKPEVIHFLLSNCRFWLDEYHVDGARFDGVTSMLYLDHGLGKPFTSYDQYFDASVDEDAWVYLALANEVIHAVKPGAITIAEDVSGMPGLAAPEQDGGCGFDYRMAMGVADCWFKLADEIPDERWDMSYLWRELTNRRSDERVVSYVESHDQALVGGKSMIFELIDAAMYDSMAVTDANVEVDRGMALHKMTRLATLATAGDGYLNFMGNEFGHPEWIDFPREGNQWSYHHARRLWHLRDDPTLRFHFLADFDKAILEMAGQRELLLNPPPRLLHLHSEDKVLAFERGGLIFCFNFHPQQSFVDYAIEAPASDYLLLMDTDEGRFGGQGRIAPKQRFFTQPDSTGNRPCHRLKFYLPSRAALIVVPVTPRVKASKPKRTTARRINPR